jgi:predicted O-methyltransferase YrrM
LPRGYINREHAEVFETVESIEGKLRPEDALKLYEMAYFADGPILEVGCFNGKSTTILALAIQAAGRGVTLHSIDVNPSRCQIAAANVKRFAPKVAARFYTGKSGALLANLDLQPAFVFIDGDHSYRGVHTDLRNVVGKLRPGGFVLLHDYFDARNDDPDEPNYGVRRAADTVLDPDQFAFCGRFGCTALFQKQAAEMSTSTFYFNTADQFAPAPSTPSSEAMLDAVMTALVNYLDLPKYGIDWKDNRYVIPELWMVHPKRRFTYFAHLSIYDFACRFAEGKRVLDVGAGVGYGDYYLVARGARQVWSLEVDERAHRYGLDRYRHDRLQGYLGTVESLAQRGVAPFQFVVCSNAMMHVADYPSALDSIHRLLAPGGLYLQVTPPSGQAKGNPYHVTNFTVPQWRDVLRPWFAEQRYFAHVPLRDRSDTNNQFDFRFEECGHEEMHRLGSISGMILCQKSAVPSFTRRFDLGGVPSVSVVDDETESPQPST